MGTSILLCSRSGMKVTRPHFVCSGMQPEQKVSSECFPVISICALISLHQCSQMVVASVIRWNIFLTCIGLFRLSAFSFPFAIVSDDTEERSLGSPSFFLPKLYCTASAMSSRLCNTSGAISTVTMIKTIDGILHRCWPLWMILPHQ